MSGNHLLTSVGNRVMEVDLQMSSSQTLPCENLTEIRCIAVSPTGSHMISFDTDGRALLVNLNCAPTAGAPSGGVARLQPPRLPLHPPPSCRLRLLQSSRFLMLMPTRHSCRQASLQSQPSVSPRVCVCSPT